MAKVEPLPVAARAAPEPEKAKKVIPIPAYSGVPSTGNDAAVIAAAIANVQAEIKRLERDATNAHASYNYASVDTFYDMLRPLMTEQGLSILMDEEDAQIKEYVVSDSRGGESKKSLFHIKFSFKFMHSSGAVWPATGFTRSVTVQAGGPQAWGQASSYAMKQFARSQFLISTGEKDADEEAPTEIRRVAAPTEEMTETKSQAMASLFIDQLKAAADDEMITEIFTRLKTKGAGMKPDDKRLCMLAYTDAIARVSSKEKP